MITTYIVGQFLGVNMALVLKFILQPLRQLPRKLNLEHTTLCINCVLNIGYNQIPGIIEPSKCFRNIYLPKSYFPSAPNVLKYKTIF